MEKLIELLNESAVLDTIFENEYQVKFRATKIISKELGFIKWLVDNDKIDFENQAMQYAKEDLSKFLNERKDKNGMSDEYAMILMLLAIQDKPIKFLISILK